MKISIITHFYNNKNYGGVLQSYALTKKLNDMGYFTEQISYPIITKKLFDGENKLKDFIKNICRFLYLTFLKIKNYNKNQQANILDEEKDAFSIWVDKNIPHTQKVYTSKNIRKIVKQYDAFITGSDQVWNYDWYNKNYFLNFVPKQKIKISYAASMGHNCISEYRKQVYIKHLRSFDAISVREKEMVELLKNDYTPKIQWVLDPVFLLENKEWAEITDKPLINGDYAFCYFLGNDTLQQKLASEFCKRKNLKLVAIKNYTGSNNIDFIDECLDDISPSAFLSLIKNAEYIFTDSFHAATFSGIFKKQVFIFHRASKKDMSSRLYSLFDFFDFKNNFCDTEEKKKIDYILSLKKIDYSQNNQNLQKMKNFSIDFLKNSLSN